MTTNAAPDEAGVVTKSSPRSVGDTVTRLIELVEAKGMKVFAVIDQAAEARRAGLALRETVLVIFGSPAAGTPVMEAVPLATLELPLKVLVWVDEDATKVCYADPDALAARYRIPAPLSRNLAGVHALTDAVVGA